MYRLRRFKAVNVAGFLAGLGKKTVEIDLENFLDKDIICIVGDNGSGKSTFMNLISPWYRPIGNRPKFIIPGKEGVVIREYIADDGTVMISKCIYRPVKNTNNHTSSCFLEMRKPGEEPVELNPNGNVSSYEALLYTYFGITKDYLTFASYSSEISSIVKMTDVERKGSVGTLVPNTKRYEVAYDIVNAKYKELRNLARNLAQKILAIRDEDSLEADFERLTADLKRYTEDREDSVKELAKMEGRLKELTNGKDIDEIMSQYHHMVASLAAYDSELENLYRKLMKLYDKLGIEPEKKGSINFSTIDQVPSFIMRYEKKLVANQSSMSNHVDRGQRLQSQLNKIENDIMETESLLYSVQAQDINELKITRQAYIDQLNGLRYTKMKDQFVDMSYDEAISFSRTIMMIDNMIHALYDEYGQLVTEYFGSQSWNEFGENARLNAQQLHATILTATAKRDQIYQRMLEKNQYREFQNILDQRPSNCHIDSCPFIATALKWQGVANEVEMLRDQYKEAAIEIGEMEKSYQDAEHHIAVHEDGQKLVQYLLSTEPLIKKYFGLSDLNPLYAAIANGTWGDILDIMRLKEIASILSEKDLYLKITMQNIPELDHAIELAKIHGTNRDLLMHQLDQLKETQQLVKDELMEHKMHVTIGNEQRSRYEKKLSLWKEVSEAINQYRELMTAHIEAQEEASSQNDKIAKISQLLDKCKEQRKIIQELDSLIRERNPKREQIRLDLDAVRRLKIEKLEVERDFTVVELIRSIIAPGKGIRKELIGIYMHDICTIANQLLLNTFDGKLYLKEFLITDKEFIIPYVYNGSEGSDISYASSAQQATISAAISLAILSKLVDKYGIYTGDEMDNTLNPKGKREFINILASQMRYVGLTQAFIITQSPSYYQGYNAGFICFPGAEVDDDNDIIKVA